MNAFVSRITPFKRHGVALAAAILLGTLLMSPIYAVQGGEADPATTGSQPAVSAANSAKPNPPDAAPQGPCPSVFAIPGPGGNSLVSISLDPSTQRAPRGREVRFKIQSKESASNLVACFRWRPKSVEASPRSAVDDQWFPAPVRVVIDPANPVGTMTYAVVVPPLPKAHEVDTTDFGVVPLADLRVTGTVSGQPLDLLIIPPVGVTRFWFAFWVTVLFLIVTAIALSCVVKSRNMPVAGRSFILRIVTTKKGYASLSQLQILLWSLIIAAGAVYVVLLSDNLLDITNGALALLGITGVTTAASKFQSVAADKSGTTVPPEIYSLCLGEVLPHSVLLTWIVPRGGGRPTSFTIQYRIAGTPEQDWITASDTAITPRFRVMGLAAGQLYEFQVLGANAQGTGQPGKTLKATTTEIKGQGPLDSLASLLVVGEPTAATVHLAWTALDQSISHIVSYAVKYRRHDSGEHWQVYGHPIPGGTCIIKRLTADTLYDFCVVALGQNEPDGTATEWAASTISIATAWEARSPQWSDLVVTGSPGCEEVEVARVQMLLFTIIAAIFVTIKIATSDVIPEIPVGFLSLMGISNGVYVLGKFIQE